jgi:hypothetical protein
MWLMALAVSLVAVVGVASAQIDAPIPTPTPTLNPVTAGADDAANTVASTAADAAQSIAGTAQSLWAQLTQTPQSDLLRIVLIVGGLVLLLAGWLVYEWIILIAGFLIGATTALALLPQDNTLIALLIFLVGGLIGAGLGALLYYVAVFLIGGYLGILVTEGIAAALGLGEVSLVAVLVGLVVGGIILVMLSFELLVVFSALVGAQMIALALNLGLGWMLLMALVGIVLQLATVRARGIEIRRRPMRRGIWVRREVIP